MLRTKEEQEEIEREVERWKNDEVRGLKYIINHYEKDKLSLKS